MTRVGGVAVGSEWVVGGDETLFLVLLENGGGQYHLVINI